MHNKKNTHFRTASKSCHRNNQVFVDIRLQKANAIVRLLDSGLMYPLDKFDSASAGSFKWFDMLKETMKTLAEESKTTPAD